jgi:outer membrane protein TolC
MQVSDAVVPHPRLLSLAVALGLVVLVVPARGAGQLPAPVTPTVPAPVILGRIPILSHGLPHVSAVIHQPDATDKKPAEPEKDTIPELTLGECIAIAVERQPALRAVQASQSATAAGQQALNNIGRLGARLSPDLPIRKEQSSRGVVAAAADVQKLHNEVVHDVTRLYYTVVYARQQEQLLEDVVAQVDLFVKVGRDLLNSPAPGEMTKLKLDMMITGQATARSRLIEAQIGRKKAEAALREVMAVQQGEVQFRVKDKELPLMAQNVELTSDMVVELALCRRPELALAAAGADAFRLEVYAQGAIRFRRTVQTLGSGSDIHSRLLPPGSRDPDTQYRPEPIPPEMPPQLVGSKSDRVARAMAFSQRADSVYEKARNLMILEAENTYLTFDAAARRVVIRKEGFTAGRDAMERVREGFDNPTSPKDQLLLAYAQAAESQAMYVESVYNYLLALAALERVTAGGVRPAFPGR